MATCRSWDPTDKQSAKVTSSCNKSSEQYLTVRSASDALAARVNLGKKLHIGLRLDEASCHYGVYAPIKLVST